MPIKWCFLYDNRNTREPQKVGGKMGLKDMCILVQKIFLNKCRWESSERSWKMHIMKNHGILFVCFVTKQKQRERERKNLPSADSSLKCLQCLGLGQTKARN